MLPNALSLSLLVILPRDTFRRVDPMHRKFAVQSSWPQRDLGESWLIDSGCVKFGLLLGTFQLVEEGPLNKA